jgi:adenylate cyclase
VEEETLRYFWERWPVSGHSRPARVQSIRLWSGVVLFSYVVTHLVNHALGLISLQAMDRGQVWFLAVWRHPVGSVALYGALSAQVALALVSLYQRRHLRIPASEALQLLLGLAIPPLLAVHSAGTPLAPTWFNTTDSYTFVMLLYWELRPELGVQQVLLLTLA